jgi:uncharacterized protein YjbJ (UPF0337 family)
MPNKHLETEGLKQSLKGKVKQVKGLAKETIGELKGDERLRVEGKIDRATGVIQEAVGKVEQRIARKL